MTVLIGCARFSGCQHYAERTICFRQSVCRMGKSV